MADFIHDLCEWPFAKSHRLYNVEMKGARFKVLIAVLLKCRPFWDMAPWRLVNSYRRFDKLPSSAG